MAYPDKALRRDMHQESPDELFTRNSNLFPLSLVFVIFGCKCNHIFRHIFDSVIADSNPVGILAKVLNYGFRTMEWLFTIKGPFFSVTRIQQFLKGIVVFVRPCRAIEFKFFFLPQLFEFRKIFPTEQPGNYFDRQEEILPVVLPVVSSIQPAPKDNGMDTMYSLS